MQADGRRVAQCTTAVFDGMIAMTKPEESWVAKWQRIGEIADCHTFSLTLQLISFPRTPSFRAHREESTGHVCCQGHWQADGRGSGEIGNPGCLSLGDEG